MSTRTLRRRFRTPSSLHAPWIGWAWNRAGDADTLADQAEAIAAVGLGGTAIYPFHGIDPDHHGSPAWCEHIAAVARRVRRKRTAIHLRESFEGPFSNLQSDLCADHEDLCLTELYAHLYQPGEYPAGDRVDPKHFGIENEILAVFLGEPGVPIRPDAQQRSRFTPLDTPTEADDLRDRAVLVFGSRTIPNRLNYLDRRAADLYLQTLPAQLYQHARRYFGSPITGFFLDGIGLRLMPGALPWDPELPSLFHETRGYSLVDALPGLFLDTPDCEQVRFDYWNIISDMLREGLATPLRSWCEDHRIRYGLSLRPLETTDPDLLSTALLPVDRNNDDFVIRIPYWKALAGMRGDLDFAEWFLVIKRAVSIARQSDGARRTALSLGSETDQLSISTLSSLGVWLLALGADTVIFERLLVELDVSIPDTGVYLHTDQRYFDAIEAVGKTHARLQNLFSRGEDDVRVAVVYPAATIQSAYRHPLQAHEETDPRRPDGAPVTTLALTHAARMCRELSIAGVPFDVIEERTLASLGAGESGELHAGAARYDMLILPPSSTLTRRTIDILHDFAVGGGRIVLSGSAPTLANGVASPALEELIEEYAETSSGRSDFFDYTPLVAWLVKQGYGPAARIIEPDIPTNATVRVIRTEESVMCVVLNNTERPQRFTLEWTPRIDGHVERWDPMTGEMSPCMPCNALEPVVHTESFAPLQCRVYVAIQTAYREAASQTDPSRDVIETGELTVRREDPNVLEMQRCTIFQTSAPEALWELTAATRELERQIAEAGHEVSWSTRWCFEISELLPPSGPFQLMIPASGMLPDRFPELRINGDKVFPLNLAKVDGTSWYIHELEDLRRGQSTLEVVASYVNAENFRSPRIVGDFWVKTDAAIPIMESGDGGLRLGPWNRYGMPYYRGAVAYETTLTFEKVLRGQQIHVDIPECASPMNVEVNGNEIQWVYQTPTSCDITGALKRGDNSVRLVVVPNPAIERGEGNGDSPDSAFATGLRTAPAFHRVQSVAPEEAATDTGDDSEE